MRAVLRGIPGDMPLVYRILPLFVAGYWPVQWAYTTFLWASPSQPLWPTTTDGPLLIVLLVMLAVWTAGYVRGAWTEGTGAGFPLAALGLACRLWTEFLLRWAVRDESIYDAFPGALSQLVWIHRNVGLVAVAYGLTLVAGSCFLERRLRKSAPAWVFRPRPFGDVRARGRLRERAAPRSDGPRRSRQGGGPGPPAGDPR